MQAKVSLKKKGQLLGFWSSLSHKPAEKNTTQGQGQDELSTADGMERCIHRTPIIDHLVVPRRIVIRLGNEVLVITGDHHDGEAADWVNIEDIATEQTQKHST